MDKILLPFIGGPLDGKTAIPPEYEYRLFNSGVEIIDVSVEPSIRHTYYVRESGSGFAMLYRKKLIEIGLTDDREFFECEDGLDISVISACETVTKAGNG